MTEKSEINQNEADELLEQVQGNETATIPNKTPIVVKFNKETKSLSVEEAALLAQKGMKFELIEKDFSQLKDLAKRHNKSVSVFLADLKQGELEQRKKELALKCSDDEELVNRIIELENSVNSEQISGFEELKEAFPNIKSPEQLPFRVTEASRLKGTLLLDEYLRYRLEQKKEANKKIKAQENAERMSLGSQRNHKNISNPETEEFIRGLWK